MFVIISVRTVKYLWHIDLGIVSSLFQGIAYSVITLISAELLSTGPLMGNHKWESNIFIKQTHLKCRQQNIGHFDLGLDVLKYWCTLDDVLTQQRQVCKDTSAHGRDGVI